MWLKLKVRTKNRQNGEKKEKDTICGVCLQTSVVELKLTSTGFRSKPAQIVVFLTFPIHV